MTGAGEQVVLVDDAGHALGTADKYAVHGTDTPLHLAFSCYVFDDEGQVLLTRRALHKRTWPGVWTNTVCGHPAPGEPIDEAVRRRARHELGLELTGLTLLLPRFRYRAEMEDGTVENELCPVFVARTADVPRPHPDEVADVAWVPWATLRDDVLTHQRDVSPWCAWQLSALPADPLAAPAASAEELPEAAQSQGFVGGSA